MSDRYARAQRVVPGGVSSPARAFGAVGGDPVFAARGEGSRLYDADGRSYVDYIQGFGAVILGHAHPAVTKAVAEASAAGAAFGLSTEAETALAERIVSSVASIERVRFVTSGTEASMTAARLARAATGRDRIVKLEGCYHGHADAFLAKAGSGVATFAVPAASGVPASSVADTIVVPYNDAGALRAVVDETVAAVFVEPVAANMGVVPPADGYLGALAQIARAAGALVVFDEVVTGFRFATAGAQARFGIEPDLTMLGKVIGGGLPVGALGGRADLMELLAPLGPVYQAGTFAAHPHAMAAGTAVLDELSDHALGTLERTAKALADGLAEVARGRATVVRAGPILCVFFAAFAPRDFTQSQAADRERFATFHRKLRGGGVLIPPSPFEAWFPSLAHDDADVAATIAAAAKAFDATG